MFPQADAGQIKIQRLVTGEQPAGAGGKVRNLFRCTDDDLPVAEGFVGNHVFRIGTAHGRLYAFPVQAGLDADACAGGGCFGSSRDGLVGDGFAAFALVGGGRVVAGYIQGFLPMAFLLPKGKGSAVGQNGVEIFAHKYILLNVICCLIVLGSMVL